MTPLCLRSFFGIVLLCILATSSYSLLALTTSVLYYAHYPIRRSIDISNILEEYSSFSHFTVSSISLHCSLKKPFLKSLFAIRWNSAFSRVYLSLFPLLFASLISSAICKASSKIHFAFLHFLYRLLPPV